MRTKKQQFIDEDNQLTQRQEQILKYIQATVEDRGYPPTVREIGLAVGLSSSSSVHSQLNKLEKKGIITKCKLSPRTIEVVREHSPNESNLECSMLPVLGRVAAGVPILATEDKEDMLPMPKHIADSRECFVLKVTGESMIKAGIHDKDMIIVRKQSSAANGDIVVALLEDHVTVKRFFKESNQIRLQPENDHMSPIYCRNVTVLGKVIGLQRVF